MKFNSKWFFVVALASFVMAFAQTNRSFAHSSSKKQISAGHSVLSSWNLQHGEVERVNENDGQVQMANHRQPRPTHSYRQYLNTFARYNSTSLYAKDHNPVFIAAGFIRILRLLLYPHHSFV